MATKLKQVKAYVSADLADQVRERAEAEGRTVTGVIRMLLREWLNGSKA